MLILRSLIAKEAAIWQTESATKEFSLRARAQPCFHRRVARLKTFLRFWFPAIAWLGIIFVASTSNLSSGRTSRFFRPILQWLVPGISEAALNQAQYVARKTGHVTEYALLALLLWRARRQPTRGDSRPWRWREAAWALGGAALYAVSDEAHQYFEDDRQASLADVLLDTAGAAAGLGALWLTGRWRKRW
jgi:VanZ family protein